MKTGRDYQEELEILRAQVLRQQQEEAETKAKETEELSPEELKKKKRKRLASDIVFILFAAMILLALSGKIFEKPYLIGASLALMGIIVVIFAFTGSFQKKHPLKIRYVRSFCSPVYELCYGGQTYTLCDNNYNNFNIPEAGDEREILLNPDNPQEFYDFMRYKKELSTAFGHAFFSIFAMVPFILFFGFLAVLFIMNNQ